MKKIGVVGAGAMGSGIAQVAALEGCDVILYDIDAQGLKEGFDQIQFQVNRMAQKGKISDEEAVAVMGRIHKSTELTTFADRELVIEAIVENLEIKVGLFKQLEEILSQSAVLASNTSSLSLTEMAAQLKHNNRFVGIHFFNPPGVMKLVEIIPALQTDASIVQVCVQTISSWGKRTVVAKDSPGFIVNKVARPFYSEAIRIMEEGLADAATIDWAMTEIGGFRMGPFILMDYIGHDVNYVVTETVWKSFFYDERYTPSFAQKTLVQAGRLGRKTGWGFYKYDGGEPQSAPNKDAALGQKIVQRILSMLINEAADTVYRGICSENDVETAVLYGVNYPKGLLAWGEELGWAEVKATLSQLSQRYGEQRYRLSPFIHDKVKES